MDSSYRIGVSIALANGVSPVLAIIGRDLLGIRAPIGQPATQVIADRQVDQDQPDQRAPNEE